MRSIVLSALLLISIQPPALARDYGATMLGPTERLFWRFDPAPTGAGRGWTGPIGYACRIETHGADAVVDRYRIQYGGGDYYYLEPIEGLTLENGAIESSTPRDESYLWQRAVTTAGNFWFADNSGVTVQGETCLDDGVDEAIDLFR